MVKGTPPATRRCGGLPVRNSQPEQVPQRWALGDSRPTRYPEFAVGFTTVLQDASLLVEGSFP
jgi:hypothetical protein